jgi:hypothetical protein
VEEEDKAPLPWRWLGEARYYLPLLLLIACQPQALVVVQEPFVSFVAGVVPALARVPEAEPELVPEAEPELVPEAEPELVPEAVPALRKEERVVRSVVALMEWLP